MDLPDDVVALAAQQAGLVTRQQLLDAGVPPAAVRWALGRRWRVVLPGVYALTTGLPDPRQRLVAALLLCGEDAVLSGPTAAAWHGVASAPRLRSIHVLVPWRQAARRVGPVVVRRTRRPDPRPFRHPPFTVSSRARAVVDCARTCRDARDARAVVVEAVQRGLVRLEDLHHEVEAGAVRGSAVVRAALLDAAAGAWSDPEAELAELLGRSRQLPSLLPNPVLTTTSGLALPTPDVWVDDVGLAVQVHSRTHHAGGEDWEGTVERDGLLGEHGVVVLGFTPRTVRERPAVVLARVEATCRALAGHRRAAVVARPRFDAVA